MAESASYPAATLPAELVSHVLRLSIDPDPGTIWDPFDERRDLFLFGKVCRAWYLAAAAWTRFVVASEKEVKALGAKVVRDERERTKAASGRTTRASSTWPAGRVRELVLVQAKGGDEQARQAYAALVRACPLLENLEITPEYS